MSPKYRPSSRILCPNTAAAVPRVIGRGPGTPTGGPGRRVALRVFKFKFRVPGAGPLKLATSEAQRRRPPRPTQGARGRPRPLAGRPSRNSGRQPEARRVR